MRRSIANLIVWGGLLGLHAGAQQVTNTNNTGPGSLREAILNAASGAVITFDASLDGQVLLLVGSELLIDKDLTIDASNLPNRFIIDGQRRSRCLRISTPARNATVCLKQLVIRNGDANADSTADDIFFGGVKDGSGILCTDNLELYDSDLIENRGEALWVTGNDTTVLRCQFLRNTGVFFDEAGALQIRGNATVRDSTFLGNTSFGCTSPAAVFCGSSGPNANLIRFERCTFTDNKNQGRESSDPDGCPFGEVVDKPGAFKVVGSTLQLYHCTVVSNSDFGIMANSSLATTRVELEGTILRDNGPGGDLYSDGTNCFYSLGGNVVGTGSVDRFAPSEVPPQPLLLQPIGDYGGPTPTMLPMEGSPAIDAHPDGMSLLDQRGFPMVGVPDAGAAEFMGTLPVSDTHYVDPNGRNIAPYTTPETAAHNPADAIQAATPGDHVFIADGEYVVLDQLNVDQLTVEGASTNGAILLGDRTDRILRGTDSTFRNLTIRNGSIINENGGGAWIQDCTVEGCLFQNNVASVVPSDATGALTVFGSGLYAEDSQISDSFFIGHSASFGFHGRNVLGGGAAFIRCDVRDCQFRDNDGPGGAFLAREKTVVADCRIANNGDVEHAVRLNDSTISNSLIRANGWGVHADNQSQVLDCNILSNVGSFGGSIPVPPEPGAELGGAGILLRNRSVARRCRITANSSGYGAGVLIDFSPDGPPQLQNCLIGFNRSQERSDRESYGAGILLLDHAIIEHCTFANNFTAGNGAVVQSDRGAPLDGLVFRNNIIWGNEGTSLGDDLPLAKFNANIIEGVNLPGNLSVDPLLQSDFRLAPTSPAINSGDSTNPPPGPTLFGSPRVVDGTPDIGADESQGAQTWQSVLDWSPPDLVYGDDFGLTHNAMPRVDGTVVYATPATDVADRVGPTDIRLVFTPAPGTGLPLSEYVATVSIVVHPAPLTITAVNTSKDQEAGMVQLTVEYTGFVGGDTEADLTVPPRLESPGNTAGSPPGTYPILFSQAPEAPNYTISLVEGTLTVSKVLPRVTAIEPVFGGMRVTFTTTPQNAYRLMIATSDDDTVVPEEWIFYTRFVAPGGTSQGQLFVPTDWFLPDIPERVFYRVMIE